MVRHNGNARGNEYVKLFYQLIQCLHHISLIQDQTEGNFSKTFRTKIHQLNSFIYPAIPNDAIFRKISETNVQWAKTLASNIRDHYLTCKSELLERIKKLALPDHILKIVIDKSLHRAKKNHGKKLSFTTISEFRKIINDCQQSQHINLERSNSNKSSENVNKNVPKTSRFVRGYTDPLSNFFRENFKFQNVIYQTIEHAYHHQKAIFFNDINCAEKVLRTKKPYQAKTITAHLEKTTHWLNARTKLMAKILESKYDQITTFRDELNKFAKSEIIHNVGDIFWGSGKHGQGLNKYGKLLSELINPKSQNKQEYQKAQNAKQNSPKQAPSCSRNLETPQTEKYSFNVSSIDSPNQSLNGHIIFENSNNQIQNPSTPVNRTKTYSEIVQNSLPFPRASTPCGECSNRNQTNTSNDSSLSDKSSQKSTIQPTKRILRPRKNTNYQTNTGHKNSHDRTGNKFRDWKMPKIVQDTLIIGDSNLNRIPLCDIPPNTQVESFPGARLKHIENIFREHGKIKSQRNPKRIILSVGINDRDVNKKHSIDMCRKLFTTVSKTFPSTEIAFCELNFSGRLTKYAQENLTSINSFAQTENSVTNIPPIAKPGFKLENDNIHWKPQTAKKLINWWFQNLNC